MLALCREQRLEHRTKHIALRYFLARELQQRGQLRLAYVASEANTADVFTKALAPCDHQRCCTQLGLLCFALLDWSCDPLFSPTLPMGLTTKYRIDDTVEREKARLVVKGFTQVCGADYDETYSPVSSYITSRILLGIVAVLDLNQMQLDMKNAFMQSKLDRVLYMYQPDYFDDGTGRVFKLLRSLYGLKQSPLLWYRALDGAIDDGVTCWVLIYVDNLLAASSSPVMLKELKGLLEAAFELREILPVVKYLGLEIVRDRPARKLWLHQQGYANNLRRRFIDEEQGGRVAKTPVSVDAYAELTFDDEEAQEREEEYRQMVGSLQFAATTTRPDIAFAYSKLGSDLTVRSDQHWREVDRCLAYLVDTRDTALEFGGGPESLKLIGYVDANDVGNKQDRTSTGGYVFVYGRAAVSWSSSRINSVTLSSTKSEYVAATDACKEGCRLRFLLAEFKLLDAGKPTILRVDNNSAITVAEGLGLTRNLKHPQLTGLGDGCAIDQEEQFDQEVDGAVRRPDIGEAGHLVVAQVYRVTYSASFAEARQRRRGRDGKGDFGLVSRSRCGSSGADNSRRMHNGASPANRLRPSASVRTTIYYGATLDSRFTAALAHRRPAALAGRLSAVLARLIYATLAGGQPCCAVSRPG
ncbi:unnamed protein product [Closterium sp. NIES-53]